MSFRDIAYEAKHRTPTTELEKLLREYAWADSNGAVLIGLLPSAAPSRLITRPRLVTADEMPEPNA